MPAPLGPFVGFSLGVVLAWLARNAPDGGAPRGLPRPAAVVALFAGLVFAPVCAYFVVFAGDWSLAYLVDSRSIPSAVDLLLVVADALAVVTGFHAGRRSVRRHVRRVTAALAAGPLVVALVFVLAFYGSLRVDGTFHQVRSDFGTQPVAGGPLGYALLWMYSMLTAGFALAVHLLRERPRKTAPAPPPPSMETAPLRLPPGPPPRVRPGSPRLLR